MGYDEIEEDQPCEESCESCSGGCDNEILRTENEDEDVRKKGTDYFQLQPLPIIIDSESYVDSNYNNEVRVRRLIQAYPPLRDKKYVGIPSNAFSWRLPSWITHNWNKLRVWGENLFFINSADYFISLNKTNLRSDNRLVQIDDNVYHLTHEERTSYRFYESNYILFVDNETVWDNVKIRNWIVQMSKKLKDYENSRKSNNMKKNAFDGIFLPDDILTDIKEEIKDFLSCKDLYKNDLRLPWKRGYMLIGPPGNGKTSLIRAICNYWGLSKFDIQKAVQKDGSIEFSRLTHSNYLDTMLFPTEENPIVCVMEDIDKFVVYQSGNSKGNADVGKVTLHDLLKGMDGLDQHDDLIVIATTNYARDMSEAIMNRPGRFDRIWEIKLPTKDNISNLLNYHRVKVGDGNESIQKIVDGLDGYSMAFVAEFIKGVKTKFKRNEVSEDEALTILDKIHKHNKMYLDYFKGRDEDHRDVKHHVGFGG